MEQHSTFPPAAGTGVFPAAPPPEARRHSPIDAERVAELQFALGNARLAALLELLLAECRERPALLRSGHDRDDLAGVRAGAFSLRAAALSVGAVTLAAAAEQLAAAPDLAEAAGLIEALDDAARATLGALHGLLGFATRLHAVA